ncbi:MAG: tryptophan 7-halogenase, partial [Elusimicrobia bacterium]|nr:tryptophan 7-halogenase [Elusimicrobiota bacterium]
MRKAWDAVVVGGGPAGSTAASLLAAAGRSVLVVEREAFPRHHVGESLLPGLAPLFERLGVTHRLERAGFFVKTGGSYIWGRSRRPWSIRFAELAERPGFMIDGRETWAWHVERARFDALLLDSARRRGAEVLQPASAVEVLSKGERVEGLRVRDGGGRERTLRARCWIDASGQAGVFASHFGWRAYDEQLRHLAVYAYYEGA